MIPGPVSSASLARRVRRRPLPTLCAVAIVVLASTLLVVSAALAATPTFTDVPVVHPNHEAITDLASRRVVSGYSDGTFRPDNPVLRQHFAKMIVLSLAFPVSDADLCTFSDVEKSLPGSYVDPNDPNYPDHYVAVCAAHGITVGKTTSAYGPYGPHDNITRQQLITMVVRAAGLPDPPVEYSPSFSAGQFSLDEHYHNARRAAHAGLLDGLVGLGPNYSFTASASRGECAQVLHNLLQQGPPSGGGDGTGTITTTPAVDSVHVVVGPQGGLFDLGQPGMLEGLQLEVPAGAYSQTVAFDVSFLPITGHTFGPDIDLVSPLIHVDNGGAIADESLSLSIPVQVPAGKFATASFYDKNSGTLEPLPLLDETDTYITAATRHFSDIVVELDSPPALQWDATSFTPRLDGWQFVNEGTVITPDGVCGGMCTAALYYFYTFVADPAYGLRPRATVPQLYGRYDNTGGHLATPFFGQDDSPAIRLCSVLQHDYLDLFYAFKEWGPIRQFVRDEITWKNLLVGLSRHQPRLVDLVGQDAAHAVIAYDAWVGPGGDGELKVADPNHPGEFRKILYRKGKFILPDEYAAHYRWVCDMGVSALWSFGKVEQRWQEFVNKTIGNDLFPTYTLKYRTGDTSTLLTDGMTVAQLPHDTLILEVPVSIVHLNQAPVGTALTIHPDYVETVLKPGLNQVPVFIRAQGSGKWADFQWLTITYNPAPAKPHHTSVNYWNNDPTKGVAFTFEYYEENGTWVLDGKERHFDLLGRLEEETTWVDGKKYGRHLEWFIGCLQVLANYYNDKLDGTYWEVPADGQAYVYSSVERQYKNGQEVVGSAKSRSWPTPVVSNLSIEIRQGALSGTSLTAYARSLVTVNFFNHDYPLQHTLSFYLDAATTRPIFQGGTVVPAMEGGAGWGTATYFFEAPNNPGTYYFRCDQHPGEKGTLIVR